MNMIEILDKAKQHANLKSDYALAKAMGVKTGHVSGWRSGSRHPSNEEAIQLATLANMGEMEVIAIIEYETAKNDKKKQFWKHYIETRGIAAALALTTMAIGLIFTPQPAEAGVLHFTNYDAQNTSGIYIMRTLKEGTK